MYHCVAIAILILTHIEILSSCKIVSNKQQLPLITTIMSKRLSDTEPPYIEDVLDMYISLSIPNLTMLALGSSYWIPPDEALKQLKDTDYTSAPMNLHRYGSIMGDSELRTKISSMLQVKGLDMTIMDVIITTGANQAISNTALALLDQGEHAIVIAPYYFSQKLACQLAGAIVNVCPFDRDTLLPQWDALENMMKIENTKVVYLTTPSNPTGKVWSAHELSKLIALCKKYDTWLVVDQTYYEFLHDNVKHVFPCSKMYDYKKIIHIFSFSKQYGMPGWRVGYLVYPRELTSHLRKLQDTIPTHTSMISQQLALNCLTVDEEKYSGLWLNSKLDGLKLVRDTLYPILQPLGTIYTTGAFYFLVPIPARVSEEEALDILARQYHVLLMTGSPFGAPGYLRLSYGSITPDRVLSCVQEIRNGFQHLTALSESRKGKAVDV